MACLATKTTSFVEVVLVVALVVAQRLLAVVWVWCCDGGGDGGVSCASGWRCEGGGAGDGAGGGARLLAWCGVAVWADCASMGRPLPLAPLACTPACLATKTASCVGVVLVVADLLGGGGNCGLLRFRLRRGEGGGAGDGAGALCAAASAGSVLWLAIGCRLFLWLVTLACWPTWRPLACPLACRPPASCIQRSLALRWCNLGYHDAASICGIG